MTPEEITKARDLAESVRESANHALVPFSRRELARYLLQALDELEAEHEIRVGYQDKVYKCCGLFQLTVDELVEVVEQVVAEAKRLRQAVHTYMLNFDDLVRLAEDGTVESNQHTVHLRNLGVRRVHHRRPRSVEIFEE